MHACLHFAADWLLGRPHPKSPDALTVDVHLIGNLYLTARVCIRGCRSGLKARIWLHGRRSEIRAFERMQALVSQRLGCRQPIKRFVVLCVREGCSRLLHLMSFNGSFTVHSGLCASACQIDDDDDVRTYLHYMHGMACHYGPVLTVHIYCCYKLVWYDLLP
jgi:hypothetical protein